MQTVREMASNDQSLSKLDQKSGRKQQPLSLSLSTIENQNPSIVEPTSPTDDRA